MKISFVVPKTDTVNEERDRFLTLAMGGCWHEASPERQVTKLTLKGWICIKCGLFYALNNDFSTIEDFLRLWEWAKNEPDLQEYVANFKAKEFVNEKKGPGKRKQFADGLYSLLVEKRKERDHV